MISPAELDGIAEGEGETVIPTAAAGQEID